jgi:hypothetical protein
MRADTGDFTPSMLGVALGFHNRREISIAGQELVLGTLGIALGQIGEVLR